MTKTDLNEAFERTSFLYGANAHFIEQLYARFLGDPSSVDPDWRQFFAGLADDRASALKQVRGPSWERPGWPEATNGEIVSAFDGNWPALGRDGENRPARKGRDGAGGVSEISAAEMRKATLDSVRALMMIRAYRIRGHLAADLDPLRLKDPESHPELDPASYGFGPQDMDRPIFIDNVLGLERATLNQIIGILKRTYCSTLGVEFMHISDPRQKAWIQERIEGPDKGIRFTAEGKRAILNKLIEAEGFEHFLNVKYTGTKRFGLDGGEAMIPALEQIIKRGGQLGLHEIVFGMAHRGRLNVLANVMAKPYSVIFHEFKGGSSTPEEVEGSGDVKYHLGSSSDREFDNNRVHLSLTANPSHLEIVDPVVLGKVRAKQDQNAGDRRKVMPLLIHGDAAFAGQGVVAECFGLSGLKGHRTGGSLHFIVNNQIGFTTSPIWGRSSPYPSDVAKMIEAPIFHVNGDDPEAVVYAAKIATEFRQKFKHPVVIDMFCYRRFGHNESDEPAFTQPIMYKRIAKHPAVVEIYGRRLIEEGVLTAEDSDAMKAAFRKRLDDAFAGSDSYKANKADWLDGRWAGMKAAATIDDDPRRGLTGVSAAKLRELSDRVTRLPQGFTTHRTLLRVLEARRKSIMEGAGIDWATAETLAFATLLDEGFPVRLSGQDVQRGTFSQRHAVIIDQETERRYTPLNHLMRDQKVRFEVINSMLSEEAVLGFEYGYSLAEPNCLVLWEAQFGDFANGAQVIFDQFISSGERKWLRMSGLTCLLPHGYEGQGPEHSSARLERYLQMCAEDNMQVANCTTPANFFHILRRQLKRDIRKPLILMTPKSLLRHKRVVSRLDEMTDGTSFHRVLYDDAQWAPDTKIKLVPDAKIRRVVLCSGKVYYDLFEEREKRGINDIYLMRVEQLYPFPHKALVTELSRFKGADMVWCQEEPYNMGAWMFVQPNLEWVLVKVGGKCKRPRYAGRPASAATATGLISKHMLELKKLIDEALG